MRSQRGGARRGRGGVRLELLFLLLPSLIARTFPSVDIFAGEAKHVRLTPSMAMPILPGSCSGWRAEVRAQGFKSIDVRGREYVACSTSLSCGKSLLDYIEHRAR